MIHKVIVTAKAEHNMEKLPLYLRAKLKYWIDLVEKEGLELTRTRKGFHDEQLKGTRSGQRSIRLNNAYRAIYIICKNGSIEFVSIEEVNKHEY